LVTVFHGEQCKQVCLDTNVLDIASAELAVRQAFGEGACGCVIDGWAGFVVSRDGTWRIPATWVKALREEVPAPSD